MFAAVQTQVDKNEKDDPDETSVKPPFIEEEWRKVLLEFRQAVANLNKYFQNGPRDSIGCLSLSLD